VGGVEQRVDAVGAQVIREPVRPAEPADPGRQRRCRGGARRTGERQGPGEPVVARDPPGKRAGLGGPAEQKDS